VTGGHKYWNGADEMQNVMAPILPRSLRLEGREELRRFRSHGGWTYASDELFQDFRETAEDVSEKDRKQFKHAIRRAISMYGSNDQKNRFIDKSQSYSLKITYIEDILKERNPYFVLITRNPYAVCQRAVMKTNLSRLSKREEEKIEISVQHWGNTMKSVLSDSKKVKNFKSFKIESILKYQDEKIREICQFLNLSFEKSMMPSKEDEIPVTGLKDKKWYPIKEDINDRYLKKLKSEIKNRINDRYSEEVEKLGYDKIEA
jgi:hypothetical protein